MAARVGGDLSSRAGPGASDARGLAPGDRVAEGAGRAVERVDYSRNWSAVRSNKQNCATPSTINVEAGT